MHMIGIGLLEDALSSYSFYTFFATLSGVRGKEVQTLQRLQHNPYDSEAATGDSNRFVLLFSSIMYQAGIRYNRQNLGFDAICIMRQVLDYNRSVESPAFCKPVADCQIQ
jgi:hypothetical protein